MPDRIFALAGCARRCRFRTLLSALLLASLPIFLADFPHAVAASSAALDKVGIRDVEWTDARHDGRVMVMNLFYPAAVTDPAVKPAGLPFFTDLRLYRDAPLADSGTRHPLIMFSHGRGSNGLVYAWLAQYLAARGYIVAAVNHTHANTYDTSILYLTTRIWQRPRDISRDIAWLTHDPFWSRYIDAGRIGIAGHSQGGFTALWIGGAEIDPARFMAYQRLFLENPTIPRYLRAQMRIDAKPALHLRDPRVKAAFVMAPGVVQAFGMDRAGLAKMAIPAYLIVGASDKQTPPAENAAFAAKYIPHATLTTLPGAVGHEIFTNECDQEGKDQFPEGCVDAPGIDRHALHALIGAAALAFFNKTLAVRPR
jgi:predicted dienelactone hydrolase